MSPFDAVRRIAGRALRRALGAASTPTEEVRAPRARGMETPTDTSADDLLLAYMKLNASDPNNAAETQRRLHELASEMEKRGIERSEERARIAQESGQKAKLFAGTAKTLAVVTAAVFVVAAVSVAALTLGPAAPLAVAGVAAGVLLATQADGKAIGRAAESFGRLAAKVGDRIGKGPPFQRPGLLSLPYRRPVGVAPGTTARRAEAIANRLEDLLRGSSERIRTTRGTASRALESVHRMRQTVLETSRRLLLAEIPR